MLYGVIILGSWKMQGRKPYREEWKIFKYNGLDSREWLVQKVTSDTMQIVHKQSGEMKVIPICT